MRITKDKLDFLSKEIKEIKPNSKLFLFGSRVDDNQKGGDIDILVLNDEKLNLTEKLKVKRAFCNRFGEQKIDIVSFTFEDKSPFKELILSEPIIEF